MTKFKSDKLPEQTSDFFIATLNRCGYMTTELDRFSKAFVDAANESSTKVLDMGAAYGVASIAALKKGASVIAVDAEARHLDILSEHVPDNLREKIELKVGTLPNIDFTSQSFDAILCSRVLHFLQGLDIDKSMTLFPPYTTKRNPN